MDSLDTGQADNRHNHYRIFRKERSLVFLSLFSMGGLGLLEA